MVVGDDLAAGGGDHARPLAEVRVDVDNGRTDCSRDLRGRQCVPGGEVANLLKWLGSVESRRRSRATADADQNQCRREHG